MREAMALIRVRWLTIVSYRTQTLMSFAGLLVSVVPVYFISAPYLVMGGMIQFYLGIASMLSLFADGFGPIFR